METIEKRNETLQNLCRDYLGRLKDVASKYGLLQQLDNLISMNQNRKCEGTEHECEMLARMCDDERLHRQDVPKLLGKSYRRAYEDGDFERVKTLKRVGIYSKISALLLGEELRAISDE